MQDFLEVYYIFSTLNKTDNLIIISCGIEVKNFEKKYNKMHNLVKHADDPVCHGGTQAVPAGVHVRKYRNREF